LSRGKGGQNEAKKQPRIEVIEGAPRETGEESLRAEGENTVNGKKGGATPNQSTLRGGDLRKNTKENERVAPADGTRTNCLNGTKL